METKQEFRKRVPGHSEATVSELDLTPYSVLLAYVPLKTEVDITPVIDLALSKGLKVAVPETPEEFVCLTPGWRNSLRTIPNGTQCPEEGEPINPVSVKPQCLMLVPGLAFTPDGRRLGRGGGFYDRVLSKLPENVRTLGICSSECLFADIPTQEHDRRVDSVLVCGKNNCMPVSTAVVLIPAYEPGEKLLPYVEELIASGFGNIVVVDDGSGPEYQKIFEGVAELPKTHVIHHEVNRGKGAALKTGCAWIAKNLPEADRVVTADSDGQHAVKDCINVASAVEPGKNALYLGSRDFTLPDIPPKSRKGNTITSSVFKRLFGIYLPDTQTGLRAFSMESIPFMTSIAGERFEYEMNVLIKCVRAKVELVNIPIRTIYFDNNSGTHFRPVKDSYIIYRTILKGYFSKA